MYGLDTSVVLRVLVGEPPKQAQRARDFIAEKFGGAEGPLEVSDLVVGEAYFALVHHYAVPAASAIRALEAFLTAPEISASGVALDALAAASAGASPVGLMDRLIHGGYRERDLRFVTLDRAAAKLPGAVLIS